MNFGEAVSSVFRKYAKFGGGAPRSEYWWWTLFSVLCSLVLSAIDNGIAAAGGISMLATLWALATMLPSLAVTVRRLRDAGYSWAFLFLALIPFVGAIILIVMLCQPSKIRPAVQYARPWA